MHQTFTLVGVIASVMLNSTLNIKKILLALNTVNPEAVSEWGFEVVVRLAKSPKSKKKTNG
ncbi:MAG: hypothetical protein U0T74_06380 [Chitinophagales bacterium]